MKQEMKAKNRNLWVTQTRDTETETPGAPGSFVRSFQGPLGQTHTRPGPLGARTDNRTSAPDPNLPNAQWSGLKSSQVSLTARGPRTD